MVGPRTHNITPLVAWCLNTYILVRSSARRTWYGITHKNVATLLAYMRFQPKGDLDDCRWLCSKSRSPVGPNDHGLYVSWWFLGVWWPKPSTGKKPRGSWRRGSRRYSGQLPWGVTLQGRGACDKNGRRDARKAQGLMRWWMLQHLLVVRNTSHVSAI